MTDLIQIRARHRREIEALDRQFVAGDKLVHDLRAEAENPEHDAMLRQLLTDAAAVIEDRAPAAGSVRTADADPALCNAVLARCTRPAGHDGPCLPRCERCGGVRQYVDGTPVLGVCPHCEAATAEGEAEQCEKCGGTDIHTAFVPAGDEIGIGWIRNDCRRNDPPESVAIEYSRYHAKVDLLYRRCRTCQWWWTGSPQAAHPTPPAGEEVRERIVLTLRALVTEIERLCDDGTRLTYGDQADGAIDRAADELAALLRTPGRSGTTQWYCPHGCGCVLDSRSARYHHCRSPAGAGVEEIERFVRDEWERAYLAGVDDDPADVDTPSSAPTFTVPLGRLRELLAALRAGAGGEDGPTDEDRLTYLETAVRSERSWRDLLVSWDHEDGYWLSTVPRGVTGARPLESDGPHTTLRAAIDAARRGEGGGDD